MQLLGNNLVDTRVLALEDAIFNKDIPMFEAQGDMGREVLCGKQSWVATLLHKQLEDILAEAGQVLVVLQDNLQRLLEDTIGLAHDLDAAQALQLETRLLEAVLARGKEIDLVNGDSCGFQDLIVLCRQDHSDMGLATRDQGAVAKGCGGVDKVKYRLDILEVDVQAHPIGEQGIALQVNGREYRELFDKSEPIAPLKGLIHTKKNAAFVSGMLG